jgi:hypothetical protein
MPRALDSNDQASRDYPSVLVAGHLLHVYRDEDGWAVWLNTEASDFDGLCIGLGTTRNTAVAEAVAALEAVLETLQEPAP